jgi:O-antigen biosynthesis protein
VLTLPRPPQPSPVPVTPPAAPPGASVVPIPAGARLHARGKFLFVGAEKFYVRGVTYGAFRPHASGGEYTDRDAIERDFALMASCGLNAVRIPHTMPPRGLLDVAYRHGLRVMVGLSAEQWLGFLIDRKKRMRDIENLVRAKVRTCAGHPALLAYALGNEIPASVVRWFGPRRVTRYLERLYRSVKAEDPDGLVTYVNYPTTEYLQLPFLDLVCFNVYLETQDQLEAYLPRLQHIAGRRPLVMSEIGLDSLRHGEAVQAHVLDWQIRTAFAAGCAGAFVFAWTDEWFRGGVDVDDWGFGLTRRDRQPKPALAAIQRAFQDVPFPVDRPWPHVSVIVCTHNGARTIRDCLESLRRLDYPQFEVIVVNDGSLDQTAAVARAYGVRVITTEPHGLGSARNTGLAAATGEIVAYIDDDAYPDPHWLTSLAATFQTTGHAAVGGPNIAPPGDGFIADCVAGAPGGPVHVLISDREAEHIPGCNMAFRTEVLREIGGFDPQFRVAGDDVDICWRLQQRRWTIGFNPAAVVWHHRRNSIRAYHRQQREYGKAEALLARKWPEKYNGTGHVTWSGRVYGNGSVRLLGGAGRIYHGIWGSAPYQSLYERTPGVLGLMLLMPEWYLVILMLGALSALGALWRPLLLVLPFGVLAALMVVAQACIGATQTVSLGAPRGGALRLARQTLVAVLHLIQPLARLHGRLRYGLAPWRWRAPCTMPYRALPLSGASAVWSERWQDPAQRLRDLEDALAAAGAVVHRGGTYDRWDLEIPGGMLGAARLLMAVEEPGSGTQFIRLRWWPRCSPGAVAAVGAFAAIAAAAALDQAWTAAALLGTISMLLALRTVGECAAATAVIRGALDAARRTEAGVHPDRVSFHPARGA